MLAQAAVHNVMYQDLNVLRELGIKYQINSSLVRF